MCSQFLLTRLTKNSPRFVDTLSTVTQSFAPAHSKQVPPTPAPAPPRWKKVGMCTICSWWWLNYSEIHKVYKKFHKKSKIHQQFVEKFATHRIPAETLHFFGASQVVTAALLFVVPWQRCNTVMPPPWNMMTWWIIKFWYAHMVHVQICCKIRPSPL